MKQIRTLGMFRGTFAIPATHIYGACKRYFGLSEIQAHTVGEMLMVDAGRLKLEAKGVKVSASVSKGGERTVSAQFDSSKLLTTWSLDIQALVLALDIVHKQVACDKASTVNCISLADVTMERLNAQVKNFSESWDFITQEEAAKRNDESKRSEAAKVGMTPVKA